MLKIIKSISLLILFFCNTEQIPAQQNWKSITTVEDVITYYPETIENMLNQFNLDYPGMEKVKLAHSNGNIIVACNALLDYYKNGATASDLRKEIPKITTREVAAADTILTNVFVIQNV